MFNVQCIHRLDNILQLSLGLHHPHTNLPYLDCCRHRVEVLWQGDYWCWVGNLSDHLDLLGLWGRYSLTVGSLGFGFLLLCPPVSVWCILLSRSAPDSGSTIWESSCSLHVSSDPGFSKRIDSEACPGCRSSSTSYLDLSCSMCLCQTGPLG